MDESFVPTDFEVPLSLDGPGFQLVPLGPQHNECDHAAWMSSIDHIRTTAGFTGRQWPTPMDLEQNRADLVGHARDFADRTGFTYTVLDGDEVIGCVYIYPSPTPNHDAEVSSWVSVSRAEMDAVVWMAVSDWIESDWPFSSPNYASRD